MRMQDRRIVTAGPSGRRAGKRGAPARMRGRTRCTAALAVCWLGIAPLVGAAQCRTDCGQAAPPVPEPRAEPVRPAGPRTIVVTADGRSRLELELLKLASVGPAVKLGIAYAPGAPAAWTDGNGGALVGHGWTLGLPCLTAAEGPSEAPTTVTLALDGVERAEFVRGPDGAAYASARFPHLRMRRAPEDTFEIRDPWGRAATCAGYTARWPAAQRGKPLAFTNPYFGADRGVAFHYSPAGLLVRIDDAALRAWCFVYADGRLAEVVVSRRDGLLLARAEFAYGRRIDDGFSPADGLLAVTHTLAGDPARTASHVFRYHAEGDQAGLLANVLTPDAVAALGGLPAALAVEAGEADRRAHYAFAYARRETAPYLVVSAFRGPRCSVCPESGWYFFEYEHNPAVADAATWAVRVTQRNPEGSLTLADLNRHEQLLNWVRTGSDTPQEFESYRYDAAGRLVRIVYPAPSFLYDSHCHEGVPLSGAEDGVVHCFDYDGQGRLIAERIGATSILSEGAKDAWTTLRTYEYTGELPWPSRAREHARTGHAPAVTVMRHEFDGAAAELRLVHLVEELPVVPASQNGSGRPTVRERFFDPATGALAREVDGNGAVSHFTYDAATGALVSTTTEAGTTRWFVDAWGLPETIEFPDGAREEQRRVALAEGRTATLAYRTAEGGARGPVAIVVRDLAGHIVASAAAVPAAGLAPEEALTPGGGELAEAWRGELAAHEERVYEADRLSAVIQWCDGDPAVTRYAYDAAGRAASTVGPDGTVIAYAYDGLSRLVRIHEGLQGSDAPLTLREKRYYDQRGRLAAVRTYADDPGQDEDRKGALTELVYDWRNRLVEERYPDGDGDRRRALRRLYDNFDRVIELRVRPRGETRFFTVRRWDHDSRGRVWREALVDNESLGRTMTTRYWYDAERTRRKTLLPGGGFKKELRDAAGRLQAVYVGLDPADAGAGEAYDDAVSAAGLADDRILEEERYAYDAGGRETLLTHREREAEGAPGAGPTSRQAAVWYDPLGSVVHTVVRAGEAWRARPDEVPAGTASSLRTDTAYDAFGRVGAVRYADGRQVRLEYDGRGRTRVKAELGAADDEDCVCTEYAYDGAGRVTRERVTFARTGETRETCYRYGVEPWGELPSALATGRLLAAIQYPDPSTGAAGTLPQNCESFAYDAQGRVRRHRGRADADGSATVHEYTYDGEGRLLLDGVIAAASSADTEVLSVARAYDGWGRLARMTTYGTARPEGIPRNEVAWDYNGFGQIVRARQEHDGACNAATAEVRCVWSAPAGGDGPSRLARLVHPAAEGETIAVDYRYTGDDAQPEDAAFGRARGISAAFLQGREIAAYAYQGIATAVARTSATAWPGFALRREYVFDDFGRIGAVASTLQWRGAPLLAIDAMRYAYDEGGRMTEASDLAWRGGGGECVRRYDGLGRLEWYAEGDRAGGVLGNVQAVERWRLSGSGNWEQYTRDGVIEARSHDADDALGALDGMPCTHDGEGNVTFAAGLACTYDAWNRLASFRSGALRCRIARDGLGRPVRETVSGEPSGERTRDLYYRHPWQVVTAVERAGGQEHREDFVWGLTHEDELIASRRRSGTRRESFYYVQDALWNVTAVLNDLGLPLERYRYAPYGGVRIWDGACRRERGESALGTTVRFQGRRLHGPPALGVYDFRYRAYRPRLGRFLQRDPARIPYAHNLYAAPFGAAMLDPYGLRPQLRDCWTADVPLVGGAGGIGLVLSGNLDVKVTVCDCCNGQNVWVDKGWVEGKLSGGLSVGFGAAVQFSVAGVAMGLRFELANAKVLECEGAVISDDCSGENYPCFSCSRSLGFGVPIVEFDAVIVSVKGAAQIMIETSLQYCYIEGRSDVTFTLCYGWEAWVDIGIFWVHRVFTLAGKKTCVQQKL